MFTFLPMWCNAILIAFLFCFLVSGVWAIYFAKTPKKTLAGVILFGVFGISCFASLHVMAKAYPAPPTTYMLYGTIQVNEGTLVIFQKKWGEEFQSLWGLVYKTPPSFKPGAEITDAQFSAEYASKEVVKRGVINAP